MAVLPEEYDRVAIEEELRDLQQKIDDLKTQNFMIPNTNPPIATNTDKGLLAYSDGPVNWDGSAASEGLYRYTGGAWVKIG